MPIWLIILIILCVVMGVLVILYFTKVRYAKKRQEDNQAAMDASKETMDMFVIDKKKMPIKDAGLPKIVLSETPKRYHNKKVPIVKAKVGPKILSLIADRKIFNNIPIKTNIKADISGIYITDFKILRTGKASEMPNVKKKK